jgi:endonuclease/exonuclease/phosphatase family metal-dependent hydrolase
VEAIGLGAVNREAMRRGERALLRLSPPQKQTALCAQGDGLRVYVVHLDVVGFKHRLEQWRAILEDMRGRPEVALSLVAGDLNTFGARKMARWPELDALAAEAGLAEVTRRIRRTHWTGQKLDAIFAKASALRRAKSWTLVTKASDHRAVFADLELAARS